jgi:type I restriction enzyme R subunit
MYSAFSQAFFQGAIRLFQRENRLQDIVMTDPEVRNKAIRHFFNRALREVRDEPRL